MKITHRSLHLLLPATTPYLGEFALESFVGIHVRPIARHLKLFWFSRYGPPNAQEVKFRFSVQDFEVVRAVIENLESSFAHGKDGCEEYKFVNDLGSDRFLNDAKQPLHKAKRALKVYQFLTAAAKLFIDSIVLDGVGWKHEAETKSRLNRQTPFESYHHLFCNMTGAPTWAALLHLPHIAETYKIVSDLESRSMMDKDSKIVRVALPRIQH